uniref:Uncharacterized protein n=1 Tax=Anguilla anguilla TaxID=7936 RepID=A0A0E9TQ91_ANGAN
MTFFFFLIESFLLASSLILDRCFLNFFS